MDKIIGQTQDKIAKPQNRHHRDSAHYRRKIGAIPIGTTWFFHRRCYEQLAVVPCLGTSIPPMQTHEKQMRTPHLLFNISLMAFLNACFMTTIFTFVLLGGIIGAEFATQPSMSTLPISIYVAGAAVSVIPISMLMEHYGRRIGFAIRISIRDSGWRMYSVCIIKRQFLDYQYSWILCRCTDCSIFIFTLCSYRDQP